MLVWLIRDWLVFIAVVMVGGLAFAPAKKLPPLEAWCVGIGAALGVIALGVFGAFVFGLDNRWFSSALALLVGAALVRRRNIAALARDADIREAMLNWMAVTAGCFLLLACVVSYNGGAWVGDWEEHYDRPLLFLRAFEETSVFHAGNPVTTRPPLANLADAFLLWLTDATFARHQIFMLLLNSLAFLPVALMARTFGGNRVAVACVAALVLINPMFLQNAAYPWTKLIAAFFVLTGLHVLFADARNRMRIGIGFAMFALGVLAHYSTCVWVLVFGTWWLLRERAHWREAEFRKSVVVAALAFTLVISPWIAFAVLRYGATSTFASNSTIMETAAYSWWENVVNNVPKIWNTLVPHTLRDFDRRFIAQANEWTYLRDSFFYLYQSNLWLGLGGPTIVMLAWILKRRGLPKTSDATGWTVAIASTIVLGIAVVGRVDEWGLAHICLQPLIFGAVAFAAARMPELVRDGRRGLGWRLGLAGAAVVDITAGVMLHFSGTGFQLGRGPYENLGEYLASLSVAAQMNLVRKLKREVTFFADDSNVHPWLLIALYLTVVALVVARGWRLAQRSVGTQPRPPLKTL